MKLFDVVEIKAGRLDQPNTHASGTTGLSPLPNPGDHSPQGHCGSIEFQLQTDDRSWFQGRASDHEKARLGKLVATNYFVTLAASKL